MRKKRHETEIHGVIYTIEITPEGNAILTPKKKRPRRHPRVVKGFWAEFIEETIASYDAGDIGPKQDVSQGRAK